VLRENYATGEGAVSEVLGFALLALSVLLMLSGVVIPFLPRSKVAVATTTNRAEFERAKREAEGRFQEETP
jgi:hypothetical protein